VLVVGRWARCPLNPRHLTAVLLERVASVTRAAATNKLGPEALLQQSDVIYFHCFFAAAHPAHSVGRWFRLSAPNMLCKPEKSRIESFGCFLSTAGRPSHCTNQRDGRRQELELCFKHLSRTSRPGATPWNKMRGPRIQFNVTEVRRLFIHKWNCWEGLSWKVNGRPPTANPFNFQCFLLPGSAGHLPIRDHPTHPYHHPG